MQTREYQDSSYVQYYHVIGLKTLDSLGDNWSQKQVKAISDISYGLDSGPYLGSQANNKGSRTCKTITIYDTF